MSTSQPQKTDIDNLIDQNAALLFSNSFVFYPKPRSHQILHFDHSRTLEICVIKYFRVLDQNFDLYSFGAPTKCLLPNHFRDACNEAGKKTTDLVTTILERYDGITNDKWTHMQESATEICEKIKLAVEPKNTKNFALLVARIQEKIYAEFKQSLKDQLHFLFVDDPNTTSETYMGRNGKELYLRKFHYHSEVIRIVREMVYAALLKCDQFALKFNPQNEQGLESVRILKGLESKMWTYGDKVVKQNKINILNFREFVYNSKEELESYVYMKKNILEMPEVEKGIEDFLETSVSKMKHACEVFAINNSGRLKELYTKYLREAVDWAVKNRDTSSNGYYKTIFKAEASLLGGGVDFIDEFENIEDAAEAAKIFRAMKRAGADTSNLTSAFSASSSAAYGESNQGQDNGQAKKGRLQ